MADVHDLKPSISDLSDSEIMKVLQDIRANRRANYGKKRSSKRKKKKKPKKSKKEQLKESMSGMNKEQAQAMLESLKNMSDE